MAGPASLVRFNDCIYILELEPMPLPLSAAGNNYHHWGMPASWRCIVVSLSVTIANRFAVLRLRNGGRFAL